MFLILKFFLPKTVPLTTSATSVNFTTYPNSQSTFCQVRLVQGEVWNLWRIGYMLQILTL
jgi:hypothetical protein